MKTIGEIIKEQNLQLDTLNPVLAGGFTQVPNFILKDPEISGGAKVAYAMFLSYAWHCDSCFPGQDRLAEDMRMSRSRVTEFVGELEASGLIGIQRRGQGKTNLYTIRFQVRPRSEKNSPKKTAGGFFASAPDRISQPPVFLMTAKSSGANLGEKNLQIETTNPAVQGGFTQIPNLILKKPEISVGAKVAYAMFLSYAWHNDSCFPGQDRLAEDMGMSRARVTELVGELKQSGLISIHRRGQGMTNIYSIHFQVRPVGDNNFQKSARRLLDVDGLTARSISTALMFWCFLSTEPRVRSDSRLCKFRLCSALL